MSKRLTTTVERRSPEDKGMINVDTTCGWLRIKIGRARSGKFYVELELDDPDKHPPVEAFLDSRSVRKLIAALYRMSKRVISKNRTWVKPRPAPRMSSYL